MSSGSQWCTIESDPGVFTSLIESFGVENAELAELWSLDDDSLQNLGPEVYGLVFLFKWTAATQQPSSDGEEKEASDELPDDLFFAKQVTTNACATQAILSILLNVDKKKEEEDGGLKLGPILSSLKSFTTQFPPDLKGEAIGASEEIRTAHNSFARNDSFLAEQRHRIADEDDDVFHFVAYTPFNDGCVYELDGLQPAPIRVGKQDESGWLGVARKAIQDRIEKYAASEIKFNLMAVVQDRRVTLKNQIAALQSAGICADDEAITTLQAQLASEDDKRQQWKGENERRRHNYLPLCLELLKSLATAGKLEDLTKIATEKAVERVQHMEAMKAKGL